LDKLQSLGEEDIRAVALELRRNAVDRIHVVEVIVSPVIGSLADAASAMDQSVFKPAKLRQVRITVAKVPLAEDPGVVAMILQHRRQRPFILAQQLTSADRMPNSGAV